MNHKVHQAILAIIALSLMAFGFSKEEGQPRVPQKGLNSNVDVQTVSFLFIGDIMGHGPQIHSAYIDSTDSYSYEEVFNFISPEISEADIAIANLEVTLAGPPYTGYPQFSSPDALGRALIDAGVDVMATANNHCCDRGAKGLNRTIKVLDSLKVKHTGTFRDSYERYMHNPLTLEKNGLCIGLLNYTYGTNGLTVPEPAVVNMLDTARILDDLRFAKALDYDALIAFVHFGTEYELVPNVRQQAMVDFLFANGVDVVIGSHPHVVQRMLWMNATDSTNQRLVTYSLGNFVSNQRDPNTDGGAMVKVTLGKVDGEVQVVDAGYYLTWVYRHEEEGKTRYNVLPCSKFEDKTEFFTKPEDHASMMKFVKSTRERLNPENQNVGEYRFVKGKWVLMRSSS